MGIVIFHLTSCNSRDEYNYRRGFKYMVDFTEETSSKAMVALENALLADSLGTGPGSLYSSNNESLRNVGGKWVLMAHCQKSV